MWPASAPALANPTPPVVVTSPARVITPFALTVILPEGEFASLVVVMVPVAVLVTVAADSVMLPPPEVANGAFSKMALLAEKLTLFPGVTEKASFKMMLLLACNLMFPMTPFKVSVDTICVAPGRSVKSLTSA